LVPNRPRYRNVERFNKASPGFEPIAIAIATAPSIDPIDPHKDEVALEREKQKVLETRKTVKHSWNTISRMLAIAGRPDVSQQARSLIEQMPPPPTDKELIAAERVRYATKVPRVQPPARTL
jgi:hypothetical protein